MRTYGQFCATAKALDVIGDRWSLLIVRELLLQDACRYTDLLQGLPGIASNLLTDRLRQLEAAEVITREAAPPPVATTLYRLTRRGEALLPVIRELGRWGAPYLFAEPGAHEVFRSSWFALPLRLYYADPTPERPPVRIELRIGGDPIVLETVGGAIRTRPARGETADVVVTGSPRIVIGVLSGRLELEDALRQGLSIAGDQSALGRVRPTSAATPTPNAS